MNFDKFAAHFIHLEMILPNAEPIEDLTNTSIRFTVLGSKDSESLTIYAAKLPFIPDYKVGDSVRFSMGATVGKPVEYLVQRVEKEFVRGGKAHEFHVNLYVEPVGDSKLEELTVSSS